MSENWPGCYSNSTVYIVGTGHYGGGRYGGGRYGGAFEKKGDAAAESHDTHITMDATAEGRKTCHCHATVTNHVVNFLITVLTADKDSTF